MRQLAHWLFHGLIALALLNSAAAAQTHFVPPQPLSATDLTYPDTIVSGMVLLSVGLDSTGHIKTIETLRDVPSATARSLIAASNWDFAAAKLNGKGVDSSVTLHILFNPANVASRRVDLNGPDLGAVTPNDQDYIPPHVKSAIFARDPANTLTAGAVALNVLVGKSGRVRSASAIFTTPQLTNAALSAVKKWYFAPASLRGVPIESNTVVIFVFRPPTTTTPPGAAPVPLANR